MLFATISLPSTLSSFPYRSFPTELSPCYFPRFPFRPPCRHSVSLLPTRALQAISHGFPSVHPLVASVSLLPTGAVPMLFPTVSLPSTLSFPYRPFPPELSPSYFLRSTLSPLPYRPFPPELSPSYFPWFPFRPPCRHSVSLLPTRALPNLFPTVSLLSTLSSLPYRSFPPELSPSYFPRFPFRPPCRRSRIAPSHRSSPQAISHGFPSVHPVIIPVSLLPTSHSPQPTKAPQAISHGFPSVHPLLTSVSLLPTGALPMLFPTVSFPCTLLSFPYRSFPPELSPSYFPRFLFRPPCRPFCIAPSHRSSPHAICPGFPSVHPVLVPVPLLPNGALPKLFPTVSLPSTLSSLPHGSVPPELSPSYFPRLPFRPPSRRFRIAPSHHELSPSYFHGFPSVHTLVASVSLLPNGALPMPFPTVSHLSTLSSLPYRSFLSELSPNYFPRFPSRPP